MIGTVICVFTLNQANVHTNFQMTRQLDIVMLTDKRAENAIIIWVEQSSTTYSTPSLSTLLDYFALYPTEMITISNVMRSHNDE